MSLIRTQVLSCAAIALLASQACGQGARASLCQIGTAVTYLAHLKATAQQPLDSTVTDASALYLADCPGNLVAAFRQLAPYDTETPRRWRDAMRAAARDSTNTALRGLLAIARDSVAAIHDAALDAYTAGIFNGLDGVAKPSRGGTQAAAERIAAELFDAHSKCEGDLCGAVSDNLVFLLGTYPFAVFKAMRTDSAARNSWLSAVADESFAGTDEYRARAEAARQAVVAKLRSTPAGGFDRERRACLETLSRIRYRTFH